MKRLLYKCAFCEERILVSKQEMVLNFDDKYCCYRCGSHKDLMRRGRQQPYLFKERPREKCVCCLDTFEEFDIYLPMKLATIVNTIEGDITNETRQK